MEIKFEQLNNFVHKPAKKLYNSMYLEDLTGLLAETASRINSDDGYYFKEEFYVKNHAEEVNSDFNQFIENFKKNYYYGSCNEIYIIRGRAGIGKTLFFKCGIQKLIKVDEKWKKNYIDICVDFRNIDNNESIDFYKNFIYKELYNNATDCIDYLGSEICSVFKEKKLNFDVETPHFYLFPLKFLCEKIYNRHKLPCIITFDNIDLATVATQENVFKAIAIVMEKFNQFMKRDSPRNCYRVFFAMRPETELRYNEVKSGDANNFPLPNILKMSLTILKNTLLQVGVEWDKKVLKEEKKEMACSIECRDILSENEEMRTFKSYSDVANYFVEILEYYLENIWDNSPYICERIGRSEEFHCNIVNYNIRIFLLFLADTIKNGGFKPFTKEFNEKQGILHYNTFDYIEMIIRGRWTMHPGNSHINGEGGNNAPIIFNVFDTSIYDGNNMNKVKHFMLYIRILQYFHIRESNIPICYKKMRKDLKNFFDKKQICKATKQLIYVRFLYSFEMGDDMLAATPQWDKVKLTSETELKLSPVGKFYLEHLICEFEYLYQMALSSLMQEEYVNSLETCWKTEKEQTVLWFLKSIFEIIKRNIGCYLVDNRLDPFKNHFYYIEESCGSQPYRRMINRFISVMDNKVQSAQKYDSKSMAKLTAILEEARELKVIVEEYLANVLK